MSNSREDLLKPRYKVIADYPDSEFKIGDIKTVTGGDLRFTEGYFNAYPAIFKRIEWYEDRERNEMPKYVKDVFRPGMVNDIYVYCVKKHFTQDCTPIGGKVREDKKYWVDKNDFSHLYNHYEPADETEYQNFKSDNHGK